MKAQPNDMINDFLIERGFPTGVEHDATIHECYLCILHFNKFETILGDIRGKRKAIVQAIIEAEKHPAVNERSIGKWIETAYKDGKYCILCGEPIDGCGNNAEPLAEGTCCDRCNNQVIMARLQGLRGKF